MAREDGAENPGGVSRDEPTRRPYFGRRLRELRNTYMDRISSGDRGTPLLKTTPSANALVTCLHRAGLTISAAAYNEIEQGYNVPRNAVPFLDDVAACLQLTEEEKQDLARRLAYDILWARLRELTDTVFPPGADWPPADR